MNIIFGDIAQQLANTHTVLELDTFRIMPSQQLIASYCVVEVVPLEEFPHLERNKKIHQDLIQHYREQNWQFCRSALSALTGCWGGDLDTFYQHIGNRVENYIQNPPGDHWDWAIVKHAETA